MSCFVNGFREIINKVYFYILKCVCLGNKLLSYYNVGKGKKFEILLVI